MAMLAEPRRRKRYNLVPRGKALYEDESRFGTKMLEKMGWSKGKGLGANENGSKDFVRVRYKNDANGLGYEERDDQWTQHEQSFNGLLQSLNGSEESGEDTRERVEKAEESEDDMLTLGFGFTQTQPKKSGVKLKEKISGESLEEKSKKSKARVHYKKFTKGKDLAQYSEKDLANIFGKKGVEDNSIYEQFTAISIPQTQEDDEKRREEPVKESNFMINTGLSVSDYFKQKLESRKQKKVLEDETTKTNEEDEPQKKINKRKRAKAQEESIEIVERKINEEETAKSNDDKRIKKKNKRKRSSVAEEPSEIAENSPAKKKKKKQFDDLNLEETIEENENNLKGNSKKEKNLSSTNDPIAKKEKILSSTNDPIATDSMCVSEKKKTKKCKKKRHSEGDVMEVELSTKKKETQKDIEYESVPNLFLPDCSSSTVEATVKNNNKSKETTASADKTNDTVSNELSQNVANSIKKNKSDKKVKDVSENTTSLIDMEDLISKSNSYNLYIISSFCAEKFRNADLDRFTGANLKEIEGYSIDAALKLDIRIIKSDEQRINQLWNSVLNKYDNAAPKNPYFRYRSKVHAARKKKRKMPRLCIKSLKRKHAFSGI